MPKNAYPKCIKKFILHRTKSNLNKIKQARSNETDMKKILTSLSYIWVKVKSCQNNFSKISKRNFFKNYSFL